MHNRKTASIQLLVVFLCFSLVFVTFLTGITTREKARLCINITIHKKTIANIKTDFIIQEVSCGYFSVVVIKKQFE